MILVDTSVWIDHLNHRDSALFALLERNEVLMHPFVLGEIALGNLRQRDVVLGSLRSLPRVLPARDREVLELVDRASLYGIGLGYVDVHLLGSARITTGTSLWTRDKRLADAARRLNLAADVPGP